MSSFYLTLIAVLLAGFGARDQATVAAMSQRQGARPGVLITANVVCIVTAVAAAWAATLIVPMLAPPARAFLAGLALIFAGGESLILQAPREPKEPTHSLAALAIVLSARQLTDAARFLIFGVAVAMNAPVPAALGGAISGMVLMGVAWAYPALASHPRIRVARRAIGVVLLLIGAFVCLRAVGRL